MLGRVVRPLKIEQMKIDVKDGIRTYSLWADNGRLPAKFAVEVEEHHMRSSKRPEVLRDVNEKLLNSLRYFKHFGEYGTPKDGALSSVWSQTDYSTKPIRPKDDPMKEFARFD